MAAAYEWFVQQFQPGSHRRAPEARDGLIHVSNGLALKAAFAAVLDHPAPQRSPPPSDNSKRPRHHPAASTPEELKKAVATAVRAARIDTSGRRVMRAQMEVFVQLSKDWGKLGARVVCLNDDIDQGLDYTRPLLNPMIRQFLDSRYPVPSQYELQQQPPRENRCR